MRIYKRKTDRATQPLKIFQKAAEEVIRDGRAMRAVAADFKICHTSLHRFVKQLKNGQVPTVGYKSRTVFTSKQEQILVDYLLKCAQEHSGLLSDDMRKAAYAFAVRVKPKYIPVAWHKHQKAGTEWLIGFIKRHPLLKSLKGSSTEKASVFDMEDLNEFITSLGDILDEEPTAFNQSLNTINIQLESMDDTGPEVYVEEESLEPEFLKQEVPENSQSSESSDFVFNFSGQNSLAEFQADEEEEFGAALRSRSSEASTSGQIRPVLRVAASAPPPLPASANPLMWPEQPTPRLRPGHNADECQIFGDFVASELRTLRSDESRKRLKRMIQKAILQIGEEEDVNVINSSNSCT